MPVTTSMHTNTLRVIIYFIESNAATVHDSAQNLYRESESERLLRRQVAIGEKKVKPEPARATRMRMQAGAGRAWGFSERRAQGAWTSVAFGERGMVMILMG